MTHSYGKRSGTRSKFARAFRAHGLPSVGKYLNTFKRGDFVTIVVNGAIQKGMPTGFYHGRTGRVFNITKNSVGVEIVKRVRYREIIKRIHLRREHVVKSTSIDDFNRRRAENDRLARENANSGKKLCFKRIIDGPREACVATGEVLDFTPISFVEHF